MRNAGDGASGKSAGRRQRAITPETPPPAGGNGGTSLFTPAASNPAAGDRAPGGAGSGYGRGADQPGAGYGWAESGQDHPAGYQSSGYSDPLTDAWPSSGDPPPGSSWPGNRGGMSDNWPDGDLASWNQPAQPAASNAIRGFPPAPGDPMPVYPPGPFAAWNRSPAERSGSDRSEPRLVGNRSSADSSPQATAAIITPDEFDTNHSIPAIKDPLPATARKTAAKPGPAAGSGSAGQNRRSAVDQGKGKAAAPAPGRKAGGARAGRKRHLPAWLAIVAAVAIIGVFTAILILTSTGGGNPVSNHPKAGGTPTPSHTSATVPPGPWRFIGTRTTDAVPLTLAELYPLTFTSGTTLYKNVKDDLGANCRAALIGSSLQTAVRQAGCSQAARATYVSRAAHVMATIGVFNLRTSALAGKAATKAGHYNFVAQLQTKGGFAHHIGQGTGLEEAIVKGHYLVLVWAEPTSLQAPSGKAARSRLESFMNLLIQKTANVGLSYRMVDGKPMTQPSG